MRGNQVKARVPRTTHYVVLCIALILAAATLSAVAPSRALAASAAFVQGRDIQVTSGTAATSAVFNITTGTTSASDCTAYLQGNDRTGFAPGENGFNPTTVQNLHLAWQKSDTGPGHGVYAQPVVSNGLVYWGSFDGRERAISTAGNLV
jgi:hypothetical protein